MVLCILLNCYILLKTTYTGINYFVDKFWFTSRTLCVTHISVNLGAYINRTSDVTSLTPGNIDIYNITITQGPDQSLHSHNDFLICSSHLFWTFYLKIEEFIFLFNRERKRRMCAVKTHRLEDISQTDLAEFSFNCYRLTISFSTHAQGERVGERERERDR